MPSWYVVIYADSGEAYSIGDTIADPMPPQFVAVPVSDDDATALATGKARWDAATRAAVAI